MLKGCCPSANACRPVGGFVPSDAEHHRFRPGRDELSCQSVPVRVHDPPPSPHFPHFVKIGQLIAVRQDPYPGSAMHKDVGHALHGQDSDRSWSDRISLQQHGFAFNDVFAASPDVSFRVRVLEEAHFSRNRLRGVLDAHHARCARGYGCPGHDPGHRTDLEWARRK